MERIEHIPDWSSFHTNRPSTATPLAHGETGETAIPGNDPQVVSNEGSGNVGPHGPHIAAVTSGSRWDGPDGYVWPTGPSS